MLARVKPDSRLKIVMAFTGHEYVGYEWRKVPEGMEAKAENHPYLDIMEAETDGFTAKAEETGADLPNNDKPPELQDMTVKEAVEMIAGITDSEILLQMAESEQSGKNRAGVLKKIEARIDELTQSGEEQ